jgi:hypothetical protein
MSWELLFNYGSQYIYKKGHIKLQTNSLTEKSKRIPFIFDDESTGSCIRAITTCATADFFCLYLCSPTPPTTRSQTRGYVTRVAVNVSGVTSVLRDLAKVTRKSSAKTYTCQYTSQTALTTTGR